MRDRSENPNFEKVDSVVSVLKVERNWLIHGMGDVEGEAPLLEYADDVFVAIAYVAVKPSMGGGMIV